MLIINLGNSPQDFVSALKSEEQTESEKDDLNAVSFKKLSTSACFRRHLLQRKTKFDP